MTLKLILGSAASALLLLACSNTQNLGAIQSNDSQGLRPLTADEQSEDFDQLLTMFKTYYGPYQYKEKLLNVNIEQLAKDMKTKAQASKTDEEFAGNVMAFGAVLKDGHVQIRVQNTASGIARYKIPMVITPLEGKAIIADITPDLAKATTLSVGDEVLAVDGQSPFDIVKSVLKYKSAATEASNLHSIVYALLRPSYMTDIVPKSSVATIRAQKVDGTIVSVEVPWETEKYNKDTDKTVKGLSGPLNFTVPFASDFNSVMPAHRLQMGQVNPIFITPQTQEAYQFLPVSASESFRKKYDMTSKEKPPIYASMYRYNGKNILLVRIAAYYSDEFKDEAFIKAYQALLDQYQAMADVLVLDQTHNPGGSYCSEFYNIFAKDGDVQAVEQVRADRKWIHDFKVLWPQEMVKDNPKVNPVDLAQSVAFGQIVENDYDKGNFLSEPIPLFTGSKHAVLKKFTWKKPMLVLIDSLAGSCGDIFPMLVRANPRPTVKMFGETTMGLGGNVEEVGVLFHSRIPVNMTRGLFTAYKENGDYKPEDYIENNGVAPDYPYSHTIKDFRAGFVDYVKAFSEKAAELAK